jgi:hypothetical protein
MLINALYSLLSSVEAHTYPVVADQEVTPPFIVHFIRSCEPFPTKDGASTKDLYTIIIGCYDDTPDDAQTLADSVRTAIDEYSGLVSSVYIEKIRFVNSEAGYEETDDMFYVFQTYRIWVNYAT